MKNFLITILVLGMAAAGCGREHVTSPVPQWHSWDQVVLVETRVEGGGRTENSVSEVSVRSDGALTLVVRQGDTVSSRGLLSGANMDLLTSRIDALPPTSYAAPDSCPADGFVLTVAGGGTVRTFVFGTCDTSATAFPVAAYRLQEFLSEVGASTQAPRLVIVPSQVLLSGTHSALHRPVRAVLQDRDALARFLREHAPDRPVAVPVVDFGRQVVVAEWLGDRPSAEYSVAFEVAEIIQTGTDSETADKISWLCLRFHCVNPCPTSAVGAQITQPFVLVALDRHPEEMLFEDTTTEVDCSPPSAVGGGL